jgi:hypothetical protein
MKNPWLRRPFVVHVKSLSDALLGPFADLGLGLFFILGPEIVALAKLAPNVEARPRSSHR